MEWNTGNPSWLEEEIQKSLQIKYRASIVSLLLNQVSQGGGGVKQMTAICDGLETSIWVALPKAPDSHVSQTCTTAWS